MTDIPRRSKRSRLAEILFIGLLAVPVLGLLMGGVYSLPAMKLTKEREPGLPSLLSLGLAVTVFGMGHFPRVPLPALAAAWAFTLVLLGSARLAYGSLGHSLERFGIVHGVAVLAVYLLWIAFHVRSQSVSQVP